MTKLFQWKHATAFYKRVERLNLHGLHFQHVKLCERRAWMYLHGINFAQ
jgi:CRISPR-associated exonuclease Cas4